MSKATFYEHFANKEECILALFDEAATELMRAMAAAGETRADGSYEDRVAAACTRSWTTLVGLARRGADAARRDHRRRARAPPRAATRSSRPSPTGCYRDNAARRAAVRRRRPSPRADDAFAIIGAIVELVSRQLRTGRPEDMLDLEPVIERLMLGVPLQPADGRTRGGDRRLPRAARGWSRGASRSRARSAPRSPTRSTGARPVPGFGDPAARVLVLGLAPAAHGAQPHRPRVHRRPLGRLAVRRAAPRRLRQPADLAPRATTASRCATPASPRPSAARRRTTSPTPDERDTCLPFAVRELALLRELRVVVCLGAFAWDAALRLRAALGHRGAAAAPALRPRRRVSTTARALPLLGCYHPSQQNTFTGRLTEPMLDGVLARARAAGPSGRREPDGMPSLGGSGELRGCAGVHGESDMGHRAGSGRRGALVDEDRQIEPYRIRPETRDQVRCRRRSRRPDVIVQVPRRAPRGRPCSRSRPRASASRYVRPSARSWLSGSCGPGDDVSWPVEYR